VLWLFKAPGYEVGDGLAVGGKRVTHETEFASVVELEPVAGMPGDGQDGDRAGVPADR